MNLSKIFQIALAKKRQQYINRFLKVILHKSLTFSCKFSFSSSFKHQMKQAEIDYVYKNKGANQWYVKQIQSLINQVKATGDTKQIFRISSKNNERIKKEFGEDSQMYYYHLMLPITFQNYLPSLQEPLLIYQQVQDLLRKYPNHQAYSWSVYMRNIEYYVGLHLLGLLCFKEGYDKLKQYLSNPKRLLLHSNEMLQMELSAKVSILQNLAFIGNLENKSQLCSQIQKVISEIHKLNYLKSSQANIISVLCFYLERSGHHLNEKNYDEASQNLKKIVQVIEQTQMMPKIFPWIDIILLSPLYQFLKLQRQHMVLLETVLTFVHRQQISHPIYSDFNYYLESMYRKASNKEGIVRCKARQEFFSTGIKQKTSSKTIKQLAKYVEFLKQLKDYDQRLISIGKSLTDQEVQSYQTLLRKFYLALIEENGRGLTRSNIQFLTKHFLRMQKIGFKLMSVSDLKHSSRQKSQVVDAFFHILQLVSKNN